MRGIKASTYIAALARAHIAANPPLTADELAAFKQAVVILSKFGLLLARWTKGAGQGSAPARDLQQDLGRTRAIIAALEQRMHDFVRAALVSWESHHD